MTNTLTKTEITHLPEMTPHAKELQFAIDFWQRQYALAGSRKEQAWQKYAEAIEDEESHDEIEKLFKLSEMLTRPRVMSGKNCKKPKRNI